MLQLLPRNLEIGPGGLGAANQSCGDVKEAIKSTTYTKIFLKKQATSLAREDRNKWETGLGLERPIFDVVLALSTKGN